DGAGHRTGVSNDRLSPDESNCASIPWVRLAPNFQFSSTYPNNPIDLKKLKLCTHGTRIVILSRFITSSQKSAISCLNRQADGAFVMSINLIGQNQLSNLIHMQFRNVQHG